MPHRSSIKRHRDPDRSAAAIMDAATNEAAPRPVDAALEPAAALSPEQRTAIAREAAARWTERDREPHA